MEITRNNDADHTNYYTLYLDTLPVTSSDSFIQLTAAPLGPGRPLSPGKPRGPCVGEGEGALALAFHQPWSVHFSLMFL